MDPGSENNDPTTTTTTASTPIPLDPVSGAALYDLEVSRRRALAAAGSRPRLAGTGCPEIDREVLLCGGFERGSVVGVSAEDVDFGVLVSSFYSYSFFLFFGGGGGCLLFSEWRLVGTGGTGDISSRVVFPLGRIHEGVLRLRATRLDVGNCT